MTLIGFMGRGPFVGFKRVFWANNLGFKKCGQIREILSL